MNASTLFHALATTPELGSISLDTILRFLKFTSISLPTIQMAVNDSTCPPMQLPMNIQIILVRLLLQDLSVVNALWDTLKSEVWRSSFGNVSLQDAWEFNKVALDNGTSYRHLYPQTRVCTQPSCPRYRSSNSVKTLEDPLTHPGTLYTLRQGTLPIYTTSLYCRGCHRRYYHNYVVHKATNIREYYSGVPEIVQVAQHFFIDTPLLEFFSCSKVFGWLSSLNCARIYNFSIGTFHSEAKNNPKSYPTSFYIVFSAPEKWHTSLELKDVHVLNGFLIYNALLEFAEDREIIVLQHDSPSQKDRLKPILHARNVKRQGIGQEEYTHACDICFMVSENERGEKFKIQPAVCDGISIGHPCYAVHDCHEPLYNNNHRFCQSHAHMNELCAETSCLSKREPGFRTCKDPEHRKLEDQYYRKNHALTYLTNRFEAFIAADKPEPQLDGEPEHDGKPSDNIEGCPTKPETGNQRIKAHFGKRRTHNEQLIMRPCGVILSRATLYGSEAVSAVYDFAKATFPTPESTPEVFPFDNNCRLHAHMKSINDQHFKNTAFPVDVFHFKAKHKETDIYCQTHCNPAAFPELIKDGKWTINMSICEQNNVWLRGYQAILRDMEGTRYNYYLDIMIKRRNRYVVQELRRKGHCPWNVPLKAIFPSFFQ